MRKYNYIRLNNGERKKMYIPEDFNIPGYEMRKTPSVIDIIVVEGLKGARDKHELATRVYNRLQGLGLTKTFKGDITPESVFKRVKASLREFKRYKYKNISLEETDNGIKLLNGNIL